MAPLPPKQTPTARTGKSTGRDAAGSGDAASITYDELEEAKAASTLIANVLDGDNGEQRDERSASRDTPGTAVPGLSADVASSEDSACRSESAGPSSADAAFVTGRHDTRIRTRSRRETVTRYLDGRTVTETITETTDNRDRAPMPYQKLPSDHPAPGG